MNKPILHQMFTYNLWANTTLIDFCSQLTEEQLAIKVDGVYDRIRPTLKHLLWAEGHYAKHLTGQLPWPADTNWNNLTFEQMQEIAQLTGNRLIELCTQVPADQPHETIGRHNTPYHFFNWTVLLQALYHAIEHRTQIKILLTHLGLEHPELSSWHYAEFHPMNNPNPDTQTP